MIFNNRTILNKLSIAVLFLFAALSTYAQSTNADKIVAIVGKNKIVLQSDIDAQLIQAKQQSPGYDENILKCQLLQQMIVQKLLVEQADRDSVVVSDDDVDATLDNRVRYFIRMYGSKENLEKVSGKTIYQLKDEYRDVIKEGMLSEKESGQILQNVKITPAEVKAFYDKIPADSLPLLPATVEIGQVVIDPPVSPEMNDYARTKLEGIRKRIVEGKESFESLAGIYSEDPGSRDNGGRINDVSRNGGGWAPEFVTATFKLQDGEVSPVIKTKFGYHIIQMISRKGDNADVRHILIRGQVTTADFKKAMDKLDSVRSELIAGKITFPEAVGKYSTDDAAKRTGGMIADPNTGNTQIEMSKLDPAMIMVLDSLQPGSFSHPHVFTNDGGDKSCRIVFLKTRSAPHKANLKDDYSALQNYALNQKKAQKMQQWVAQKLPTYYLKIDPEYRSCGVFKDWNLDAGASK